jgi:BirA family biotin operon repressor/biotin-[acetyl-CoA-carboxylase] ligase
VDAPRTTTAASTPEWKIHRFNEIDSTNRWLSEQAAAAAPDGTVVIANHQSAGRGRLDRAWEAPADSALLLSVLVRPSAGLPLAQWHLLTMAMALAVCDAAAELLGSLDAGTIVVKWPNDVIVPSHGDRKLAGILAETADNQRAVVVGVGVNVGRPAVVPDVLTDRAVWLDELGVSTSADELATGLLEHFAVYRDALQAGRGSDVLVAYRERCATLGHSVRVELPGKFVSGRATSVTSAGHLVVTSEDGRERSFSVGDVVHVHRQ